jgi:hypothetical protein
MGGHSIPGLVMGLVALALGLGLIASVWRRRGRNPQNAPTYAAAGGPLYAFFQLGCASLLILAGLLLLGIVVLTR